RQSIGANVGWDYQVSAWYHVGVAGTATVRLGIDPAGGTDPAAPGVGWMKGSDRTAWRQLAVRATAVAGAITIFLECDAESGDAGAWFDSVELLPYPCLLG